ncbi:MAG: universal stress protein [Candidatus Melainabacteria bacterium]|nr:universal stress protein [Candidatus Melainabacteria bacterium]
MKTTHVLVALDGSEYSQNASLAAFWMTRATDAELEALAVVDPRIVDLFLSPEFAEDLGLKPSIDASAKIIQSLKRIANIVLNLWKGDCQAHLGVEGKTHLELGDTTEEILKRGKDCDLIVVGHRGVGYKDHQPSATHFRIGSVAERVAVGARKSVLISVAPPDALKTILVAYDGSEASKGALLLAEQLAVKTGKQLKAIHVVPKEEQRKQSTSTIELGASLLRNYIPALENERVRNASVSVKPSTKELMDSVFSIKVGPVGKTILDEAQALNALLIIGAYGFKDPEENTLGSTTTHIVRSTRSSVLVYR